MQFDLQHKASITQASTATTPVPTAIPHTSAAIPLVPTTIPQAPSTSTTPKVKATARTNAKAKAHTKSATALARSKLRHCTDWYLKNIGIWGDRHYVIAWHALGHQVRIFCLALYPLTNMSLSQWSDAFAPSRELLGHRTTLEMTRRYQFLDSRQSLDARLNHLVSLLHPYFSCLLHSARHHFNNHPVIKTLLPIWTSDFFGHAVLMNKRSGEHLDASGVRKGWDVIVASGDFTGGDLYLKDMNIRTTLAPGDVVLFDGTAQRHSIMPFEGPQRMSHVFFVHQSVFTELGIDTSELQDPTVRLVHTQVAKFPKARAQAQAAVAGRATRSRRGGQNNKRPSSL